jgi:capsid protein
MSFASKVKDALGLLTGGGKVAPIQNNYEGGARWSTDRTYRPGYVRDIRFDADTATRTELIRVSRIAERNSGIYQKILEVYVLYTAGHSGPEIVPASSSHEWNLIWKKEFQSWSKYCDLVTLNSLGETAKTIARTECVDGEVFIYKTYGRDNKGVRRPRIQLIEAHRVATPPGTKSSDRIYDGVEFDEAGRPIAYHVKVGIDSDKFQRVDAYDVIHHFRRIRVNQIRGLPRCYSVINDLRDLDDLQLFEMRKAKENARTAKVVKTRNSEAPVTESRRQRFSDSGSINTGAISTENRVRDLDKALGGETIALFPDETYEEHRSDTPSAGTQFHWDYILSKVCNGFGIAKLLISPYSVQGTVVRADLETSAAMLKSSSEMLNETISKIYQWVLSEAVYTNAGGVANNLPDDFRNVTIRAPKSFNVDIGRNSRAMLEELSAGIRTFEDIYGEVCQDWMERLEQKAKEAAFIKGLSVKYDIDPSQISTSIVDRPERISTEHPMTSEPEAAPQPTNTQ